MSKFCGKCQKTKDTKEFCKHPMTRDGLRSTCKPCANQAKKDNRKSKSSKDTAVGPELEGPKPNGRTCRHCSKPLYVNWFYHPECLREQDVDGLDDEAIMYG